MRRRLAVFKTPRGGSLPFGSRQSVRKRCAAPDRKKGRHVPGRATLWKLEIEASFAPHVTIIPPAIAELGKDVKIRFA